ncbi:MAG: DMT family transporter [Bacteroidales bacterium]|jgi:drug/metabolite transporter (DMT)-like permease
MTRKQRKGHIAVLTTNIIFGANIPIAKTILPLIVTPFVLIQFRYLGAVICFWIVSFFTKKEHVPTKDLLTLFFASIFGVTLNQGSFIIGLEYSSAIDASIIITLTPVITMILALLFLKEPISFKKAFGVFLGLAGALLLILASNEGSFKLNRNHLVGHLFCLLSCLSYAIYLTAFKNIILKYSPITIMKWMFLFASIMFLPFSFKEVIAFDFTKLSIYNSLALIHVVFAATFITYLLIPIGQKNIRPTTMTMYNNIQPLIATIIGISLGKEHLTFPKIIAAILIFFGVYLVTISKSKVQEQTS